MSELLGVKGLYPRLGADCKRMSGSIISGDVECGDRCSFWFHSVVRGDVCSIRIGDDVNIQDGAVLHGTYQRFDLWIGSRVSIGHRALVHGCRIEDDVLIGMGAIVMDGAHVQSGCLIAAGAVVTQGMVCESGWIYGGLPAKPIKQLSEQQFSGEIERIAKAYQMYASWYDLES